MDTIMTETENRTLSDKFMLRLPDGMRDRIKAAAEANSRSMNAEIVHTLEEKYPPEKDDAVDVLIEKLERLKGAPNPTESMLDVIERTLAEWAAKQRDDEQCLNKKGRQ